MARRNDSVARCLLLDIFVRIRCGQGRRQDGGRAEGCAKGVPGVTGVSFLHYLFLFLRSRRAEPYQLRRYAPASWVYDTWWHEKLRAATGALPALRQKRLLLGRRAVAGIKPVSE